MTHFDMFDSFDDAYRAVLKDILGGAYYRPSSRGRRFFEIPHYSFIITNPAKNEVSAEPRKFKHEFAHKFFEWIWTGESDITKLFGVNDNAKNYSDEDMKGRNTAYGPRFVEQRDRIIEELKRDPDTRRAVINILYPTDSEMLEDSFNGLTKVEFPCTIALQFMIRNGKLNLHVLMRSNNAVTTLCYDVYNFTHIQMAILQRLQNEGMDVELGHYYHTAVSMHIFQDEMKLAEDITVWYTNRQLKEMRNDQSHGG